MKNTEKIKFCLPIKTKTVYNQLNMILIAGLGNPDKEYEKTRHNYGFMVVDEIKKMNNFPEFRLSKEYNALISADGKVILAKPQTYMNASGRAIKSIASYYKIPTKDIMVIHDDADVKIGEIKEARARGSAGHNGVQSVIDELKTNGFKRLRMGIASDDPSFKIPIENGEGLESVVLKNFSKEEEPAVEAAIKRAAESISKEYI